MADDIDVDFVDPSLCINPDSPGESCGGTFDHKTSPGLCARCYMATKDAARAEDMKDWPQCTGCSAQLKHLKGLRCGTCLRKDLIAATPAPPLNPLGTQNPNLATKSLQDIQAEARRDAMRARTLQNSGSRTPASSSSLQVAVAKGTSRQITVYLVPVTSSGSRTDALMSTAPV
ncbi:hypothetical protein B0H19DRAFT_1234426 [Mycena capillaripes]|nr:hypothetical protein B0H19DRAFT_1234426 [Mycena capillaripes]